MELINSEEELEAWTQREPAAMLLFGGANCSVCEAIKPRLQQLVEKEFPKLSFAYTACDGEGRALCASQGLFSIPVIWLFFEGKRANAFIRVFSLIDVREAIQRPYEMMYG